MKATFDVRLGAIAGLGVEGAIIGLGVEGAIVG
jgi:hypothetical protein